MEKIKSYYLTDNEIVVKYDDKKEVRFGLNQTNLRKVIKEIDKQIDFNTETIEEQTEEAYNVLLSKLILGTIVEAIIALSIFLSFANGVILGLIITTILLGLWFIIMVISVIKDIKKYYTLNKSSKVYEGREILNKEYNTLSLSSDNKELLNIC